MNNIIREWGLSHFDSRIRYSEVDEEGLLRADRLIDYFQDCSTFQSEDGGVGLRYMTDLGVAWIVNYWQIEINRSPVLGETVRTGTSPYRLKGFIGERNFVMEAEDGEILARANSFWSLFDLKRMRPYPVTDKMLGVYNLHEPFDMDYKPRKIAVPDEPLAGAGSILIDGTHLDSNGHVNNAQYIRFLMRYIPEDHIVRALRIEYRKQVTPGETLVIETDGKGLFVMRLNDEAKTVCAVAELQTGERRPEEKDAWQQR